jgi:hypothetical protein
LAIPAGVSISGCSRDPGANYCNGLGYGMKITDVAQIRFSNATTGMSLAYGQTENIPTPAATNCKGTGASVSTYFYGTTNNQLVDISPSGNICAGTWNRNSGGGVANYTVCNSPDPAPSTNGLPYAVAYVTASAQSIVSNPFPVFVHAPATSVSLVTTPVGQQCYSQGKQATLDAQVCFAGADNKQYLLCAPSSVTIAKTVSPACDLPYANGVSGPQIPLSAIPNCSSAVGILNYFVNNAVIAGINSSTITNEAIITAQQPGTTVITSSLSTSGSSAGFFSTCPPKSISLTLSNGDPTGTINQGGVTQNLVTKVLDTNDSPKGPCPPTSTNPTGGCPLVGMTLTYQSTNPVDISVSGTGSITTSYPGVASVYALCEPPNCNPAPLYEDGLFGTGLPISSNPVTITTQGTASDYLWFGAPGQSQYIFPLDLLTGTAGASVRLPYVPNSMVMDPLGNTIYLGSSHGLMSFSTGSESFTAPNINVPGVVLAVSPDASTVLVNDQDRQVFYLFSSSSSSATSFGGMGNAAAWTPDSQTLYITDNKALNNPSQGITGHSNTLYVYNKNTNWAIYDLPESPLPNTLPPGVLPTSKDYKLPANTLSANTAISSTVQNPAIAIPSVGAYLRGKTTVAHTWCPTGTVGDSNSMFFYPGPDQIVGNTTENVVDVQTDVLTSALTVNTDGKQISHILGASATDGVASLADINVTSLTGIDFTSPALTCQPANDPLNLGAALSPLVLEDKFSKTQLTLGNLYVSAIDQIIVSPASNLVFITYTPVVPVGSNTNAPLPYYIPNPSDPTQLGTVGYVPLTTQKGGTSPSAPLAGIFTPDNKYFFVSTAGDNMVHVISIPTTVSPATPPTDTQQISPNLPACTPSSIDLGCTYTGTKPGSSFVPATAIALKPRSTT